MGLISSLTPGEGWSNSDNEPLRALYPRPEQIPPAIAPKPLKRSPTPLPGWGCNSGNARMVNIAIAQRAAVASGTESYPSFPPPKKGLIRSGFLSARNLRTFRSRYSFVLSVRLPALQEKGSRVGAFYPQTICTSPNLVRAIPLRSCLVRLTSGGQYSQH